MTNSSFPQPTVATPFDAKSEAITKLFADCERQNLKQENINNLLVRLQNLETHAHHFLETYAESLLNIFEFCEQNKIYKTIKAFSSLANTIMIKLLWLKNDKSNQYAERFRQINIRVTKVELKEFQENKNWEEACPTSGRLIFLLSKDDKPAALLETENFKRLIDMLAETNSQQALKFEAEYHHRKISLLMESKNYKEVSQALGQFKEFYENNKNQDCLFVEKKLYDINELEIQFYEETLDFVKACNRCSDQTQLMKRLYERIDDESKNNYSPELEMKIAIRSVQLMMQGGEQRIKFQKFLIKKIKKDEPKRDQYVFLVLEMQTALMCADYQTVLANFEKMESKYLIPHAYYFKATALFHLAENSNENATRQLEEAERCCNQALKEEPHEKTYDLRDKICLKLGKPVDKNRSIVVSDLPNSNQKITISNFSFAHSTISDSKTITSPAPTQSSADIKKLNKEKAEKEKKEADTKKAKIKAEKEKRKKQQEEEAQRLANERKEEQVRQEAAKVERKKREQEKIAQEAKEKAERDANAQAIQRKKEIERKIEEKKTQHKKNIARLKNELGTAHNLFKRNMAGQISLLTVLKIDSEQILPDVANLIKNTVSFMEETLQEKKADDATKLDAASKDLATVVKEIENIDTQCINKVKSAKAHLQDIEQKIQAQITAGLVAYRNNVKTERDRIIEKFKNELKQACDNFKNSIEEQTQLFSAIKLDPQFTEQALNEADSIESHNIVINKNLNDINLDATIPLQPDALKEYFLQMESQLKELSDQCKSEVDNTIGDLQNKAGAVKAQVTEHIASYLNQLKTEHYRHIKKCKNDLQQAHDNFQKIMREQSQLLSDMAVAPPFTQQTFEEVASLVDESNNSINQKIAEIKKTNAILSQPNTLKEHLVNLQNLTQTCQTKVAHTIEKIQSITASIEAQVRSAVAEHQAKLKAQQKAAEFKAEQERLKQLHKEKLASARQCADHFINEQKISCAKFPTKFQPPQKKRLPKLSPPLQHAPDFKIITTSEDSSRHKSNRPSPSLESDLSTTSLNSNTSSSSLGSNSPNTSSSGSSSPLLNASLSSSPSQSPIPSDTRGISAGDNKDSWGDINSIPENLRPYLVYREGKPLIIDVSEAKGIIKKLNDKNIRHRLGYGFLRDKILGRDPAQNFVDKRAIDLDMVMPPGSDPKVKKTGNEDDSEDSLIVAAFTTTYQGNTTKPKLMMFNNTRNLPSNEGKECDTQLLSFDIHDQNPAKVPIDEDGNYRDTLIETHIRELPCFDYPNFMLFDCYSRDSLLNGLVGFNGFAFATKETLDALNNKLISVPPKGANGYLGEEAKILNKPIDKKYDHLSNEQIAFDMDIIIMLRNIVSKSYEDVNYCPKFCSAVRDVGWNALRKILETNDQTSIQKRKHINTFLMKKIFRHAFPKKNKRYNLLTDFGINQILFPGFIEAVHQRSLFQMERHILQTKVTLVDVFLSMTILQYQHAFISLTPEQCHDDDFLLAFFQQLIADKPLMRDYISSFLNSPRNLPTFYDRIRAAVSEFQYFNPVQQFNAKVWNPSMFQGQQQMGAAPNQSHAGYPTNYAGRGSNSVMLQGQQQMGLGSNGSHGGYHANYAGRGQGQQQMGQAPNGSHPGFHANNAGRGSNPGILQPETTIPSPNLGRGSNVKPYGRGR